MHAEGLARNVWQLSLFYAPYLSPPFHLWCNTVVRTAIEQSADLPTADYDPLVWQSERQFRDLHRRLDTLDRHAAGLMLLALSGQDLLLGERRKFSIMNRILMIREVAAEPHGGQCTCCSQARILSEDGQPVPGRPDRPLLPSRPQPAGAWLAGLRGLPWRADPWGLPRPLRANAPVPAFPGPCA